jgi:hypothetical protein
MVAKLLKISMCGGLRHIKKQTTSFRDKAGPKVKGAP